MTVQRWMLGLMMVGGCATACATATADRCVVDADCKGSRVCSNGTCEDPSTQNDASPQNDGGGGDTGNNNNNCDPVGTACSSTANCCQSGAGIGPSGALCISNDNLCHAACATNTECQSGCCALVEGQSLGVCAAMSACAPTCTQPGGGCTLTTECCQTGTNIPYGATCLTDDLTCHDICYASSECTSGCCIQLQGLSYGACGSAAGHVCL